jgi:hypothetical protein
MVKHRLQLVTECPEQVSKLESRKFQKVVVFLKKTVRFIEGAFLVRRFRYAAGYSS